MKNPGQHHPYNFTPKTRRVRGRAVDTVKLSEDERKELRALEEEVEHQQRPATRGGCGEARPCPFVSCKHHLYLDVTPAGSIKLNFPDKEVWELEQTCALDVAEWDGLTLEQAGKMVNLSKERVRQIEEKVLASIRSTQEANDARRELDALRDALDRSTLRADEERRAAVVARGSLLSW